jgi:TRAP-type mannitol/chloroaromatic compound transport system permease large subunit
MEWYIVLLLVFGGLLVLMLTGIPIAMAFLIVNLFGAFFLFGGLGGIEQLILSIYSNLASFSLLPLPLFILMGDVLYHSGIGPLLIDVLDRCWAVFRKIGGKCLFWAELFFRC